MMCDECYEIIFAMVTLCAWSLVDNRFVDHSQLFSGWWCILLLINWQKWDGTLDSSFERRAPLTKN